MPTLPSDRTKLALAQSNQNPLNVLGSSQNKNALTESYDTIDLLYNYVLSVVAAYTTASGAATIGTSPIIGLTKTNVQAMLAEIEAQVLAIVAGAIPTNSITTTMIQDLAITAGKIATGAIGATQLSAGINAQIANMQNNIYELALQNYYDGKLSPKNGMQYDGFSDSTKTNAFVTFITANVAAGAVTCTVNDASQLNNNEQIAIYDGTNYEERIITKSGNVLSWTGGLTNGYTANITSVARTSSVIDTTNKWARVGNKSSLFTDTAVSVVAAAYDTSGSGGRKIAYLSNGWWVAAAVNGTTQIVFNVSKDNGATWSQLCFITIAAAPTGVAIANSGTIVSMLTTTAAGTSASFYKFDALTVTNVAQAALSSPLSGQSSFGSGASLTIAPNGNLTATVSSVNATYPNSKNIISQKSVDGVTWTKQDGTAGVDQLTSDNITSTNSTNPCVVIKSNGYPSISYQVAYSGGFQIDIFNYSGTAWSAKVVYDVATYSQINSCTLVKQYGSNIGRIVCRWQGLDATDVTYYNERWAYSDDGGVTWTVVGQITSGNTVDRKNGSLSEDTSGNVFNTYQDGTSVVYQSCPNGTTTFGSLTTMNATGSNPSSIERLGLAFTVPPTVYMSGTSVLFNGTYITSIPVKKTAYYSKRISYPDANKTAKLWLTRNITISTTPSIAIAANATSATLTSVANLAIGDTIDFYNPASTNYTRERRAITGIAGNVVSWVTGLTNAYSTTNTVARVDDIPTLFIGLSTDIESFAAMTYSRTTVNTDGTVEDTYDYTQVTAGTDVVLKITQTRNDTTLVNYVKKYGMALSA
jgi:hypothetical protein